MQMSELGRTGISVSRICLGSMTWGEQNTQAEGHAQMDYALDQGINFIDTAEMYAVPPRAETQGATEAIIGNWFAANGRREDWVLATKIAGPGRPWIRNGAPADGKSVEIALNESLKRLQTDYVDLYQIHWPNREHYNFSNGWDFDPYGQNRDAVRENIADILYALDRQIKAGKIRAIGLSNDTSWGALEFIRLAQEHGLPRVASIQNEYNLLRRQYDHDLAEVSFFEDVSLLAYSPLAAGLLSGKYLDGACPKGSRGDIGEMWRQNPYSDAATRAYMELAKSHNLDPCQMAIAYCLTKPFMGSVIIGATSMEQLKSDIGAYDITLSDTVLDGIEAIHRQFPKPV